MNKGLLLGSIIILMLFIISPVEAHRSGSYSINTNNLAPTSASENFTFENLSWIIEPYPSPIYQPAVTGYLSEYFIDGDKYHTAQLTTGSDKETIITLDYSFNPGDTFTYDVNYVSGEGNIMSRIFINGYNMDTYPFYSGGCSYCGAIGYWNENMSFGNSYGVYTIKIEFLDSSVKFSATRPDGTIVSHTVTNFTSPYWFSFSSRTGHNGLLHFDYGNFKITSNKNLTNAEIDCNPNTINLKSQGNWITCFIELQEPNASENIDINSILINNTIKNERNKKYGFVKRPSLSDKDGDGLNELMVKFSRKELRNWLVSNNITKSKTAVEITGISAGTEFEGFYEFKIK